MRYFVMLEESKGLMGYPLKDNLRQFINDIKANADHEYTLTVDQIIEHLRFVFNKEGDELVTD